MTPAGRQRHAPLAKDECTMEAHKIMQKARSQAPPLSLGRLTGGLWAQHIAIANKMSPSVYDLVHCLYVSWTEDSGSAGSILATTSLVALVYLNS